MSAAVNLAGLYPPTERETFQDGLLWRPIPIHTIPEKNDNIIAIYEAKCPAYDKEFNALYDEYYHLQNFQYLDFYRDLSRLTGLFKRNLNIFSIYDRLYVYKNHNVSYLPPWYYKIDLELLDYLAGLEIARESDNVNLQRLRCGPFSIISLTGLTISSRRRRRRNFL